MGKASLPTQCKNPPSQNFDVDLLEENFFGNLNNGLLHVELDSIRKLMTLYHVTLYEFKYYYKIMHRKTEADEIMFFWASHFSTHNP